MSDAGSHGGASVSEVMTPVIALGLENSAVQELSLVNQQDLASTLAFLTGVPIPRNNLGSLIPSFIGSDKSNENLAAWLYNAEQVAKVLKANFGPEEASKSVGYKSLLQAKKALLGEAEPAGKVLGLLQNSVRLMGEELTGNLLEYDLSSMALGFVLMACVRPYRTSPSKLA